MYAGFDLTPTDSTGAMLDLLARMKAESERTSQITSTLDAERQAGQVQLDALVASNLRTEAEVADIEARTLAAAGNAYAGADLLAMQQAERLKLEAECKQLEAELAQSELAMGAYHEEMIRESASHAAVLPELRCAFRKRCRDGYSNAVRHACSLRVLESEAFGV